MNDREMKVMNTCLVDYFEHFRQNPDSLLARIYGIFTVRMEELVPVHILLMQNSAQAGKNIEYVFDLKGSEANRFVPEAEQTKGGTLKCMNLLSVCKEEFLLVWQRQDSKIINERIRRDTKFLRDHNIMDHSLLLIIETNPAWIAQE